jgi:hypothetical protein
MDREKSAIVRSFECEVARREEVPLMVGLVGPSSSGKTYSGLRFATGVQRVTGGDIFVIDTEADRAKHYADKFKFRHVRLTAPFSPLDYLAAIEFCVKKGAKIIMADSASHEHEGPGGVLEWHAEETKELAKRWNCSEQTAQMSAWQAPKAARRRLINTVMQLKITTIWNFRAKEKLLIVKKKDPQPLGWMAIAGDEFVYEMTARFLLLPGADGVPTWQSDMPGERETIKLPEQFRQHFSGRPHAISEADGEYMARWAKGEEDTTASRFDVIVTMIRSASTRAQLEAVPPLVEEAKEKRSITPKEHGELRSLFGERRTFLAELDRKAEAVAEIETRAEAAADAVRAAAVGDGSVPAELEPSDEDLGEPAGSWP